jgi:hypothetical protein
MTATIVQEINAVAQWLDLDLTFPSEPGPVPAAFD